MKKNIVAVRLLTTWNYFIEVETKKEYFLTLCKSLNILYETKYMQPPIENIFRALTFFDYEDTKVVILGQDPYHKKDMADGLAFSTQLDILPKSLNNIFKEIYLSLGISRKKSNLEDWAHQGILLLNTILTVELDKPLSNKNMGWEIFTKNLIEFLDSKNSNIIYLLMGKNAAYYSQFIKNSKFILKTNHPSPLSSHINFFDSNVFKIINEILIDLKLTPINW